MSIDIVRHWRLKAQRYRLVGKICPECNQKLFPPRPICPHCAEITAPGLPWMAEANDDLEPSTTDAMQMLEKIPAGGSTTTAVQTIYQN